MKKPIPFGKYYLLERINVGGMAEVFRAKAFGVEGFERLVAVKRILPNIAEDEEFITMFIDEAKIAVQLQHANVAQIFDLGKVDDSYFIALEFVHGKDLRTIFDRNRQRNELMLVPQACFIVMQVCEGLDYAHNKRDGQGRDLNLVHRDISPQNVLIGFDGEIKLIDFGIAKAAGKASKTQAGILKGKFGYMSPEQVRGLPIDRRSDIFAVGICLYELLTGERLFVGESDFSTLEKVRNVEILPPSSYNRKIPEELERIVLKALAKDVDDRYQNAIDLHDDLQAFLYTIGEFYSRKDLAAWMKKTFAAEVEEEKAKQEQFRQLGAPPEPAAASPRKAPGKPGATPAAPNAAAAKAKRSGDDVMSWDDEELETQIFDKVPDIEDGGEESGVELKSGEIVLEEDDDRTVAGSPPPGLMAAAVATPVTGLAPPSSGVGLKPFTAGGLPAPGGGKSVPGGAAPNPKSTLLGMPVAGIPLPGGARPSASIPAPAAGASRPTPRGNTLFPGGPRPDGPPVGRPTGARPAIQAPPEPMLADALPQPLPRKSRPSLTQVGGSGTSDADMLRQTIGKRRARSAVLSGMVVLAILAAGGGGYWAYRKANLPGELQIIVVPGDAAILLDNVKVSETSPFSLTKPPGAYTVSATRDGDMRADQAIDVRPGEPLEIKLTLEPSADTGFELTSDPAGELVWIDGQPLMAPGPDGKMQQHRTNFRAHRIPPGKHVIEIKGNPKFRDFRYEGILEPNLITKIHAPLEIAPAMAAAPTPAVPPRPTPVAAAASTAPTAVAPPAIPPPAAVVVAAEAARPARDRRGRPSGKTRGGSGTDPMASPGGETSPSEKPERAEKATRGGQKPMPDEFEMPLDEVPAATKKAASPSGETCTITVNTKPWAQVWVDGKNTSKNTPLVDHKIPCGKHKITFKRPDLSVEQSFPLTLEAGQPFKKVFPLIDSGE